MQFVRNGPDVPERLLQAHEDGRVVFFCGAGISYPAGLPGFAGLVEALYDKLSVMRDAEQQAAIDTKRFDMAIGLLENGIVGGREKVRGELPNILTPNLGASGATATRTATHDALLTLSRNREGRTRLVTTNFDRLFEEAIRGANLDVERFQAPMLPVPKDQWDGLVYLHGLLSEKPSAQELDRLVVSSGDFGLAYLIERWAARFVGELFRNYTVCFVGYSIDDPVLRYMTDALAADRLLGGSPLEMFAFGSYSRSRENEQTNRWKAKNVTPILHREYRRHRYLHGTLHEWAKTYRDGILGKEQIVARYASSRLLASTRRDDFVGRMLWALSDPSGLPAKRFADHDPVPSLDWLDPLGEERYGRADLSRFGVMPHADGKDELKFSLIRRPSSYTRAPRMTLVGDGAAGSGWDYVMFNLARWLTRHLDDPKLMLWLTERGGRLRHQFAGLVERRLGELDKLESGGNTGELDRIRDNAPRAIPRPAMRTLWQLMLAGRMKSSSSFDIDQWRPRFGRDGFTAASRLELRDLLTPRIALRKPIRWDGDGEYPDESKRVGKPVDWDIVLSSDHVHSALPDLCESPRWPEALPDLLDDSTALLRDAMDLMRELGGADDKNDWSYMHQPSIDEHPQNRGSDDWTALIELTRDAWLETATSAPERARLTAEAWCLVKYPVFRRLAFFAAAHENIIPPRQGFDWLLTDDCRWLWSVETRRETVRLLVKLASDLDTESLTALEQAVLAGPPRAMYRDDLDDQRWSRIVDRGIWFRLAKMNETGAALGTDARAKFDELTSRYPDWRIQEENRDEFSFWIGDASERIRFVFTPRGRRELMGWIRRNPKIPQRPNEDDWGRRCHTDFPTTACVLCALARDGDWRPVDRWREALRAWSEEKHLKRSWRYMAPVLASAPDDVLQSLSHGVSGWLMDIAEPFDHHEALFFDLCRRVLAIDDGDDANGDENDFTGRAIDHPIGQVTEALLNWWHRSRLEDGQGLPDRLKPIFTELCDARVDKFRHGRVFLAPHVVTLFRVDREWAERHMLPLFDWRRCETEARAAWEGFLWSPRLYRPLMESIKEPFLDTARHYEALDRHGRQYAALLTYTALDLGDTFTVRELAAATEALPEEGLRHAADTLARALDGSGDRRAEYWRNRALPYLRRIWPKSRDLKTPAISEALGKVCIAAGDEFPEALEELRHWLQPPQHPGLMILRLRKFGLCGKFPVDALAFLHLVIDREPPGPNSLADCLEQIKTAKPQLEDEQPFQRLSELLRR